ncbi:MAG TPA: hypothetical protein EYG00_11805 [Alcanivorax sp.]|nr:hypothetical protein [Alcanivorax sp.]
MKNVVIASAIAAALSLSAAPAFAQNLSERQNMDSFENINAAYQEAVEQGRQARDTGRAPVDYLAARENLDQAEFIADQFREIQSQRAVVKAEGNPEGRNQDYLEQRKNLDSLENINRVTDNS